MAPIPPFVARVTANPRGVEIHTTHGHELLTVSSRIPKASGVKVLVMPGAPSSLLLLVVRMLLVAMPRAPSSVLAPSSKAKSP